MAFNISESLMGNNLCSCLESATLGALVNGLENLPMKMKHGMTIKASKKN
jgi:hypothetical protein